MKTLTIFILAGVLGATLAATTSEKRAGRCKHASSDSNAPRRSRRDIDDDLFDHHDDDDDHDGYRSGGEDDDDNDDDVDTTYRRLLVGDDEGENNDGDDEDDDGGGDNDSDNDSHAEIKIAIIPVAQAPVAETESDKEERDSEPAEQPKSQLQRIVHVQPQPVHVIQWAPPRPQWVPPPLPIVPQYVRPKGPQWTTPKPPAPPAVPQWKAAPKVPKYVPPKVPQYRPVPPRVVPPQWTAPKASYRPPPPPPPPPKVIPQWSPPKAAPWQPPKPAVKAQTKTLPQLWIPPKPLPPPRYEHPGWQQKSDSRPVHNPTWRSATLLVHQQHQPKPAAPYWAGRPQQLPGHHQYHRPTVVQRPPLLSLGPTIISTRTSGTAHNWSTNNNVFQRKPAVHAHPPISRHREPPITVTVQGSRPAPPTWRAQPPQAKTVTSG